MFCNFTSNSSNVSVVLKTYLFLFQMTIKLNSGGSKEEACILIYLHICQHFTPNSVIFLCLLHLFMGFSEF